jgi:hypothetical protein
VQRRPGPRAAGSLSRTVDRVRSPPDAAFSIVPFRCRLRALGRCVRASAEPGCGEFTGASGPFLGGRASVASAAPDTAVCVTRGRCHARPTAGEWGRSRSRAASTPAFTDSRLRAMPAAGGAGLELRSGASPSGPSVSADCVSWTWRSTSGQPVGTAVCALVPPSNQCAGCDAE